jgi:replicative DNA helicase
MSAANSSSFPRHVDEGHEASVLRHNLDAEASILGGILLDNRVLEQLDLLEQGDFYDHKHKVVFAAIRTLAAAGKPIDVVTLEVEIENSGKLEAIGGIAFLGELTLRVPTADNVECYRDTVKLHARNRAAEVMLGSALHRVRVGLLEPEEIISETIGELSRFEEEHRRDAGARSDVRLLSDLAADIVKQSAQPELDYGIDGLNRLAPLPIRSMCTLVGPTGGGKTSLAMTIGAHRCRYATEPAAMQGPTIHMLFELTPAQLAARRTSQRSHYTQRQVLGGEMAQHELEATLAGEHFYVVKPPRRADFYEYAQRALDGVAKRSPGVPLLVVDYLQRIRGGGKDLRIDVANIVDSIVDLVESRDMYCLLLSKGSRHGSRSMRDGKTRGEALVDVAAETSAIEAGSAAVLVITYEDRDGNETTDARIEVAKGRFGSTGASLGMRFHGPSGRWEELDAVPLTKSERLANQRVLNALTANPEGFASQNKLATAAGGKKQDTLAAIKRLHVPGGSIERRGDRLCLGRRG